jgi:hypothetical protein
MKSIEYLFILLLIVISGCMPYSVLQTPKPIPKDSCSTSFNMSILGEVLFMPSVVYRKGLNSKTDAGVEVGIGYLAGDLKYSVFDKPFSFSVGIGGSIGFPFVVGGGTLYLGKDLGFFFPYAGYRIYPYLYTKTDDSATFNATQTIPVGFQCSPTEKIKFFAEVDFFKIIPVHSEFDEWWHIGTGITLIH